MHTIESRMKEHEALLLRSLEIEPGTKEAEDALKVYRESWIYDLHRQHEKMMLALREASFALRASAWRIRCWFTSHSWRVWKTTEHEAGGWRYYVCTRCADCRCEEMDK